ncbi:MAG: hypothetical protein HZB79_07715 [Deltaproteobacteria bacterium]|nr:hypothetical protein [Deltaproteobacteria bacterium]
MKRFDENLESVYKDTNLKNEILNPARRVADARRSKASSEAYFYSMLSEEAAATTQQMRPYRWIQGEICPDGAW